MKVQELIFDIFGKTTNEDDHRYNFRLYINNMGAQAVELDLGHPPMKEATEFVEAFNRYRGFWAVYDVLNNTEAALLIARSLGRKIEGEYQFAPEGSPLNHYIADGIVDWNETVTDKMHILGRAWLGLSLIHI